MLETPYEPDPNKVDNSDDQPNWTPIIHAQHDPHRRLALQHTAEFDGLADTKIQKAVVFYLRWSSDLVPVGRKSALKYIAHLIEEIETWQALARRVSISNDQPRGYYRIHVEQRNLGERAPHLEIDQNRELEDIKPADWGPAILAEHDPHRRCALEHMSEFDGMVETKVRNATTLYHLWSTDQSLYSRKLALKYIANLIADIESWQVLVRRVCIADYQPRKQLRIHEARRIMGEANNS